MPGNTSDRGDGLGEDGRASMRPQRNAGEYAVNIIHIIGHSPRFNEAPAKCRGILPIEVMASAKMAALQ